MSFSTAELFQTSGNGSITHNGKKHSQIRKGNSVKLNNNKNNNNNNRISHRHKDSSQFVHHVPNNSTTEQQYRLYDDLQNGNNTTNDTIFQNQHIADIHNHQHHNNNNNQYITEYHPPHHYHKHNNSLASVATNHHHHARNNTISKYMLDDTLDIIDGDIPSQKDIMKDFFQGRVNNHLQQRSSTLVHHIDHDNIDNNNNNAYTPIGHQDQIAINGNNNLYDDHNDNDNTNNNNNNNISISNMGHSVNNVIGHPSFSGTMREIIGTPLDETDIINFNELENIEIEDYSDNEEETALDPMKLIAAKNNLRKNKNNKDNNSSFPDTQAITSNINKNRKKRRKHNNTKITSPLTPASVVIKGI